MFLMTGQQGKRNSLSDLSNYFLHGVVLFCIGFVAMLTYANPYYMWSFHEVIIYYIIISIILIFVLGIINTALADLLWSFNTKSNKDTWVLQGLIIILPILLLQIPFFGALSPDLPFPPNITIVLVLVMFFSFSFFFGLLGVSVAKRYRETSFTKEEGQKQYTLPINGTRGRCPSCGASYKYTRNQISEDKTVRCLDCGHIFYIEPAEELQLNLRIHQQTESRIDL
jgi:predicted Zn finger-like uncharacterized protein